MKRNRPQRLISAAVCAGTVTPCSRARVAKVPTVLNIMERSGSGRGRCSRGIKEHTERRNTCGCRERNGGRDGSTATSSHGPYSTTSDAPVFHSA